MIRLELAACTGWAEFGVKYLLDFSLRIQFLLQAQMEDLVSSWVRKLIVANTINSNSNHR